MLELLQALEKVRSAGIAQNTIGLGLQVQPVGGRIRLLSMFRTAVCHRHLGASDLPQLGAIVNQGMQSPHVGAVMQLGLDAVDIELHEVSRQGIEFIPALKNRSLFGQQDPLNSPE